MIKKKRFIFFTIILCIGLYLVWDHIKPIKYEKFSIILGEDIHETQTHSTCNLNIGKHESRSSDMFAVVDTPTIFEYRDPELGFTLPPTKLITILTQNSKVYAVSAHPQMKFLNLNDCKNILKNLLKLFDERGWKRNPHYKILDLDNLQAEDFENRVHPEIVVGSWKNDNKTLFLDIIRERSKIEIEENKYLRWQYGKPYQDYYLIEVSLSLENSNK